MSTHYSDETVNTTVPVIEDIGGGGIGDEAPDDGLPYCRNGSTQSWVKAIQEAPDDGMPYCRNGSTQGWVMGMPLDLSTLPIYTP